MKNVIENIKKSKNKLYICVTGGGSGAISQLLEDGGASEVFMGAQIPYCEEELSFLIGSYSKAVSLPVAKQLSKVGYTRSFSDELEEKCIGIGATCSLSKAGVERKGREHKVCIAVSEFSKSKTLTLFSAEIILKKDRTRKEEEDLVSDLILRLINFYLNPCKSHPLVHECKEIGLTDEEMSLGKQYHQERIEDDEKSD